MEQKQLLWTANLTWSKPGADLKNYEYAIVGVFSTRERAQAAISALVPGIEWHVGTSEDNYSEWIDDKTYYFEARQFRYEVQFASTEIIELDAVGSYFLEFMTTANDPTP